MSRAFYIFASGEEVGESPSNYDVVGDASRSGESEIFALLRNGAGGSPFSPMDGGLSLKSGGGGGCIHLGGKEDK
ncbi:Hypothetical predicted protein [Cloeon dipterum]|uniref:Uncharacterized protein n=1 Tax=Cloeon dipterum TaxID=197152 RepID=A0A8S1D376_9INSE|nr:Hypothetical predicted protein [Cloeon dipterum]